MRDLGELDSFRVRDRQVIEHYGDVGDETCGVFRIPHGGREFTCIASANDGWDHVSVSLPTRCPSYPEMDFIKRRFFKDDEVAMQLHVPVKDHVNVHLYCLHLWRPHDAPVPLPPIVFV
jgi:hypothetical protein